MKILVLAAFMLSLCACTSTEWGAIADGLGDGATRQQTGDAYNDCNYDGADC